MKFIGVLFLFLIGFSGFSQNNYIVKTEDGRRVLLKADYTWEYIDMPAQQSVVPAPNKPKPAVAKPPIQNPPPTPVVAPFCGYGPNFKEPKLNTKIQAHLKRSRATMKDLKKKVAKDYTCTTSEVILLQLNESNSKGEYTFCVNGNKIAYKRVGNSFFKKGKLF